MNCIPPVSLLSYIATSFLEVGRGYQDGHRGGQADSADLGHTDINKEQKVHFRESGWKGTSQSQEAYRAE